MSTLNLVFQSMASIVTGMVNIIVSAFTGVAGIWVQTVGEGSSATQELTLVGAFSLIAFVFGLVWLAIKFIGSLISLRTAR